MKRAGTAATARACLACAPGRLALVALVLALPLIPGAVLGQESATGATDVRPNWLITPSISLDGTYTDNARLLASKKSDRVTRLSPGLRVSGRSSRAEGSLNYQLHQFAYAEKSSPNVLQKSLAANGKVELVDQWLFVEGGHSTSHLATSAFATQSSGDQPNNPNNSKTSAFNFSPYIQGNLGGFAEYQLRFSGSSSRSDSGALAGGSASTTNAWDGRLAGATTLARVGWAVSANNQVVKHSKGTESRTERLLGTLNIELDRQIRLLINAGRESDNFNDGKARRSNNAGVGLDWAPTERTQVSLKKDQRSFGNSFSVSVDHRTGLSAWKFSDSRDVRITPPTLSQAQTGAAYDLVYMQLTSRFPDPVERAEEANRQLAQAGISATAPTFAKLLTSQVFIERKQTASMALMGANNTVIFAVDRSTSERIGSGAGFNDDFAVSSSIRQSGFNTSWAHKLTPDSALTLNLRNGRSQGAANLDTLLKSLTLQFTTRLGASSVATLGLRQNQFTNTIGTGYDETALTCSLQLTF